jgi:hypothetical protein
VKQGAARSLALLLLLLLRSLTLALTEGLADVLEGVARVQHAPFDRSSGRDRELGSDEAVVA